MQRRWISLEAGTIKYYKNPVGEAAGTYILSSDITIRKVLQADIPLRSESHCFIVSGLLGEDGEPKGDVHIYAPTAKQLRLWKHGGCLAPRQVRAPPALTPRRLPCSGPGRRVHAARVS